MQSRLSPPSVFSYYIGLLRSDHTKSMLASVFRRFGKVLRLRLAKEKSTLRCKGYGYTTIELLCSEDKFISECLVSEHPIYLKRIEGPKRLGAEHCSLLRRYAVFENISAVDREHLVNKLKSFSALDLDLSQTVTAEKRTKYALHILFEDQKVDGLLQAFLQKQNFSFECRVTTFEGSEDVHFDQIVPPAFVRSHRYEKSLMVEIRIPANQMESNRQGFDRTATSPKPRYKDSALLLPETSERMSLLDASAHQHQKCKKPKSQHSFEFRSFKKIACTININQLTRYRLFLNASHCPSNIRLNLAAPHKSLAKQQLIKNLRASACDHNDTS